MENCPYCLQTKPSPTPATPSSRDAWEDDVLNAEIERVEKLISIERSKLYMKRNERRSPIYSLPQEILTLIFKFTCPPLDFLRMYGLDSFESDIPHPRIIGVLAAVSVRWHDVVLSTPSLWASFSADDQDMTAMRTICTRSGNLPLVASLDFSVNAELCKPRNAILAPILKNHASRIRMLSVLGASRTWLKEHIPSCVNLDLLCLDTWDCDEDEPEPVAIDSPCTSLVLKCISRPISFPWSQIEVLHLTLLPTYDCLELLKKCLRLREYRVRLPSESSLEGKQLPSSPFILPCLELFEWMIDYEDPVDRAMMQYIRMPALRTLVWNEKFINLAPSDFLSPFFEHLPSTLSAVRVQCNTIDSDISMFSYIMNLSSVERLMFGECSESFMDGVFSNLGSETRLVENQEMPVLPKLKSIYIDGFDGNLDQTKMLMTFQRIRLQPLESQQGSPFRLEFAKHEVDWTPEYKEELIRMVEEGYKVELWEDSKPVDWLPRRD